MQKLITIYLDKDGYRVPGSRAPGQVPKVMVLYKNIYKIILPMVGKLKQLLALVVLALVLVLLVADGLSFYWKKIRQNCHQTHVTRPKS